MKKVLLIDSGSGGVNILKECVKEVPHCDYLLFCDDKNLPYGNKTKKQLAEITLKNLHNIFVFFKFDIVVLACNTLTSTCLEDCRKAFPNVVFVGTVPAIKPALTFFQPKDILVLATKATIKHNKTINKTQGLILKSMPFLASKIDENLDNLIAVKQQLETELSGLKAKGVVLGCTHYSAVKDSIREILGENIVFFDSANGVARRLKSFVEERDINFQVQIMVSGKQDFVSKLWWFYHI